MSKVAVLGASGIGKYHAREYKNSGCDVIAILGSSEETAEKTSLMLKEQFGINARPYFDIDKLLLYEKLDAVSVCTPPEMHYLQVKKCLEAGLNVLCEKPFVSESDNYGKALELINLAKSKGKILTINTQWVSVLKSDIIPKEEIDKFSIFMEPVGFSGLKLLTECLPHFNSMLLRLFREYNPKNILIVKKSDEEIEVNFNYRSAEISYLVKNKKDKPAAFGFSINDAEYKREIGENYSQFLISKGKRYFIEDPLKTSIKSFVSELRGEGKSLITQKEILENIRLQDIIVQEYVKSPS